MIFLSVISVVVDWEERLLLLLVDEVSIYWTSHYSVGILFVFEGWLRRNISTNNSRIYNFRTGRFVFKLKLQ